MSTRLSLVFFLGLSGIVHLNAASFSFEGFFTKDDDLRHFRIAIGAPSVVTFRTLSYGGGVNELGNAIAAGGFDPILTLFQEFNDPNGLMLGQNDNGSCPPANNDPVTNACWDSELTIALTPGLYTLVLSQSDNFALGPFLADGFLRAGQGYFTGPTFVGTPGAFYDANMAQRTSAWAVDVLDVQDAVIIPEPSTLLLLLSGIAAAAVARRRRTGRSPRGSVSETKLILRRTGPGEL